MAAHATGTGRVRIAGLRTPRVSLPGVRVTGIRQAAVARVVFLTVRPGQVPAVGARVGDWAGRIVVDVTNFPADASPGGTGSERVGRYLPGARLVKALNALPPSLLAEAPRRAGVRRVVFLAGDDDRAVDVVGDTIQAWGFAVLDLGSLREGGALIQPGGPLFGLDAVIRE